MPQYRTVKSVLIALEKLTYQKFRGIEELDEIAAAIDAELDRTRRSGDTSFPA